MPKGNTFLTQLYFVKVSEHIIVTTWDHFGKEIN